MIYTVNNLVTAFRQNDYETLNNALDANADLATSTLAQFNPLSHETDKMPVFTLAYQQASDPKMKAIRKKFFEKGANVNYQFSDGSTLGHSFACIATQMDTIESYLSLMAWILDGGDVSLKDREGDNPLKLISKNEMIVPSSANRAGRAILIGLDKRNAFPVRMIDNNCYDNPDEIEEMTSQVPELFTELDNPDFDLASVYKCDTVGYRALRELIKENEIDINAELQTESGGTLGHIFAMEAANRDDERCYLRLIRWIRDGGDLDKEDKLGYNSIQRLYSYATFKDNKVPFPGLNATLAILELGKADAINEAAEKTDSRAFKFNRYPFNKIDRLPILDTKEGLEVDLRQSFKKRILAILEKKNLTIKTMFQKPLIVKTTLIIDSSKEQTSPISKKISNKEEDSIEKPAEYHEINSKQDKEKVKIETVKKPITLIIPNELKIEHKEEAVIKPDKEEVLSGEITHTKTFMEEFEDYIQCPLTFSIMKDPYVGSDGHTYEYEAIVDWLKTNEVSPMTNQPMKISDLKPNYFAKQIIASIQERESKKK